MLKPAAPAPSPFPQRGAHRYAASLTPPAPKPYDPAEGIDPRLIENQQARRARGYSPSSEEEAGILGAMDRLNEENANKRTARWLNGRRISHDDDFAERSAFWNRQRERIAAMGLDESSEEARFKSQKAKEARLKAHDDMVAREKDKFQTLNRVLDAEYNSKRAKLNKRLLALGGRA